LIEALKEGGRNRKTQKNVQHNGNIKFDDIIKISKTMREAGKSMAVEFDGTCKEILGTAVSLGCTIDGKTPKETTALINEGEIKCS
jgi:large subunit ribosomal protein L12e